MSNCTAVLKNDSVANLSAFSYADAVSDPDLWRAVGADLRRRRERLGFGSSWAFHQKHRGVPVPNTLDAIEEGRPGRVDNLERYCKALGVTMGDVLRSVLDAADGLGPSLTDADWTALELLREIPPGPARDAWLLVGRKLAEHDGDDLEP